MICKNCDNGDMDEVYSCYHKYENESDIIMWCPVCGTILRTKDTAPLYLYPKIGQWYIPTIGELKNA